MHVRCGPTTWGLDAKKREYMCLIDLLNENHTQNWLNAIFKMPKLNFEQKNHILGIFKKNNVLLQIVVAWRYNESWSTIVRLVERDNFIGSAIDY